jgi:hypothetical protein
VLGLAAVEGAVKKRELLRNFMCAPTGVTNHAYRHGHVLDWQLARDLPVKNDELCCQAITKSVCEQ